jgi:thymidylate synthase (FAD)
MSVELKWITPDAEDLIAYCARVSSTWQDNPNVTTIIRTMLKRRHWSPFEMAHACFEINTTRTIARQILRHRSFSYQEFSQRYATVSGEIILSEARDQHPTNRQSSVANIDPLVQEAWNRAQESIYAGALDVYNRALAKGMAKEVARNVLPEGLTPSRMYMVGSIRSWLHYLEVRLDEGTQKEHQLVAQEIFNSLNKELPTIFSAWGQFRYPLVGQAEGTNQPS